MGNNFPEAQYTIDEVSALHGRAIYRTSGTNFWTRPYSVNTIKVYVRGAGAGGSSGSASYGGAGGGAGALIVDILDVFNLVNIEVYVGKGGVYQDLAIGGGHGGASYIFKSKIVTAFAPGGTNGIIASGGTTGGIGGIISENHGKGIKAINGSNGTPASGSQWLIGGDGGGGTEAGGVHGTNVAARNGGAGAGGAGGNQSATVSARYGGNGGDGIVIIEW